jgi:hypothetical protein
MSIPTLFLLTNMAIKWNVPIGHGDIPNACVRATLKEEIYMDIPQDFKCEPEMKEMKENNKKLKLLKTLYGLKQSGREWNQLLHSHLIKIQFKQCATDPCCNRVYGTPLPYGITYGSCVGVVRLTSPFCYIGIRVPSIFACVT